MDSSGALLPNSIFTKTDFLNASIRDGLSDKIAIIDAAGSIVAVNEALEEWAAGARIKAFPGGGIGANYLNLCREAQEAGIYGGVQAFEALSSILRGSRTMFALEYTLELGGRQHRYLMNATALSVGFRGALISHREITLEPRVADILRSDGRTLSLASVSRSFLPALVRSLAASLNVEHAFLSEVISSQPRRLRIVAQWAGDDFAPMREYLTDGTPCARILDGGFSCFSSDVQTLFPSDAWLRSVGVQSYSGVAIHDSAGRVLGHLAVCDPGNIEPEMSSELALRIAALRAAPELERRRAEEFGAVQTLLIRSARDAIIGTDAAFHITSWNPAAEGVYGWLADEVLGKGTPEVLLTEYVGINTDEFIEKLNYLGEFRGEFIQRRRDGTPVDIEATAMALRDADGTITGYVTVNRDVTERKLAEQSLHRALTIKDQFLSLVSHELRSPIAIIMGNAWEFAHRGDDQDKEESIKTGEAIYQESVKLNRIIENLLTLARTEKGETLTAEPVQVSQLMKRLVTELDPEDHEVQLNAPNEIPIAMASEVAVEQVMLNLVSNAKKYSSQGSPISLDIDVNGDELVVSVCNQGAEISPVALPFLFQPFYRADEVRDIPGMGIGLTVCQRLVEAMHGRIWAENYHGGAKFAFTLPVAEGQRAT